MLVLKRGAITALGRGSRTRDNHRRSIGFLAIRGTVSASGPRRSARARRARRPHDRDEPVDPYEGDIFAFDATAPEPRTAELRALRDDFAASLAPALAHLTGTPLTRADLRAYAYREGHYLLPHTDHQHGLGRALAYAYYLPSPEPPAGGELELFRCTVDDAGAIVATDTAQIIEPRPNRLVVFEVSDVSLHQVREVVRGLRLSLAGWFYP